MSKKIHEIYFYQSKKSRTRIRFQKISLDEVHPRTIEHNEALNKEIDETDEQPLQFINIRSKCKQPIMNPSRNKMPY